MYFSRYLYLLEKTIMKKFIFLLVAAGAFRIALAQSAQPQFISNPYPKTISVSGSAEMEIIPDEIYVNIELTEYLKKGEPKKDIETLKTDFLQYCKAAAIPDSAISIVSYSGYNNYYHYRKRKNPDMLASITYQIKFTNSAAMDDLIEKLDDNATRNFQIVSTNHSHMIEFRKQLKIKAVQAAKAKGIYLAEAIDETLGETITILEPEEWQPSSYRSNVVSNMASQAVISSGIRRDNTDFFSGTEITFKKIKLRYEVNVVFALK
jgi:uncharacterized protein YggE